MVKKFKMLTMFGGILIFMFLSLSNVHAASIIWDTPGFTYSAGVSGVSCFPGNYSPNEGYSQIYSSVPNPDVGIISSVADVQVVPGVATAQLSAGAWGYTTDTGNGGTSASAFVSFNVTDLVDNPVAEAEGLSYIGDTTSWVRRNFTVSTNGFYNLHGNFTGTIDFTGFGTGDNPDDPRNPHHHAIGTYSGAVTLEECSIDGTTLSILNSWELSIDNMNDGLNVRENIRLRTADAEENPIYYSLSTESNLNVNISNLMMNIMNQGPFPEDFYEYGNADDPFVIEGWLVESSPVPVPGTLLLLFSGVTGLFGFKLSLRRRGSSNR